MYSYDYKNNKIYIIVCLIYKGLLQNLQGLHSAASCESITTYLPGYCSSSGRTARWLSHGRRSANLSRPRQGRQSAARCGYGSREWTVAIDYMSLASEIKEYMGTSDESVGRTRFPKLLFVAYLQYYKRVDK